MAPFRTVRIGLLICGTLSGPVETIHGSYLEIYSHYFNATAPPNVRVVIDPYWIKKMEFPSNERISEYDLFMVTGSATNAYDDSIEWVRTLLSFLKDVIENHPKVKSCGICFGHQIVCRALGGQCTPNAGQWEIGPTPVDLTDMGKSIFGVDQVSLQQTHRDHVPLESLEKQFASGDLHLIGHTGVTGNQGVLKFNSSPSDPEYEVVKSHRDIHVLTLQGHPEFSESIVTGIVRQRAEDGAMDVPTATNYWGEMGGDYEDEPEEKQGTGRRWRKTDGFDIVAVVLWKMLGITPTEEFMAKTYLWTYSKPTTIRDVSTLSKSWFALGRLRMAITSLNPFASRKAPDTGCSLKFGLFRKFYDLCLTYLFSVSA
ncbi:Putative glutamine amidotransferase-like protein C13C5.04 [Leucoagaricus sp. SymC.cos]|nr:Putative glutamine amidotransferase-like protein C13C5.04 [Leucoagaricus sp. SymC.cos]